MMKTAVSLTEGTSHGRMYLSGGYGGSPHGALPYKTVTAMKEKKKSRPAVVYANSTCSNILN